MRRREVVVADRLAAERVEASGAAPLRHTAAQSSRDVSRVPARRLPPSEDVPSRPGARPYRLMRGWLDIPLGRCAGRTVPTWGALAERYDRCLGRVAFYVGQRVRDRGSLERIMAEAIEGNLDLLVADHDELDELRRLRATVDRLIATSAVTPGGA